MHISIQIAFCKLPAYGIGMEESFTILSLSYPPALSITTFFISQYDFAMVMEKPNTGDQLKGAENQAIF